jgi:PTS system nitrogen regulatory IIA component
VRLADILSVERVTVRLAAEDKRGVLRALAQLFVEDDPRLEAAEIQRVFEEREALASTGVGSGVAIPHGRLPGVERLVAAVGLSPEGVEFEAIDGRPAHILVAVLGPERQTGEHLKALARFSRVLRDAAVRGRLLAAEDAQAALDVLLSEDGRR